MPHNAEVLILEQSHALWKLISLFRIRLSKHTRYLCANIQRHQTKRDRIALELPSCVLTSQSTKRPLMTRSVVCSTCVPRRQITTLLSLVTSLAVAGLYNEPISWGCGTFAKHKHQT
jgi:hypothetical protein